MGRPLNASNLAWRIEFVKDGVTSLVQGPLTGRTNGSFLVPANQTGGGTYRVSLTATDSSGRRKTVTSTLQPANPPPKPHSYYPLRGNAKDTEGHFDGTLYGGASFVGDGTRGSVLNLSGTGQYLQLPPGASDFRTFAAWVKWNGGAAWQRIFDFGTDTTHYTVLTPSAQNGKLRFNISLQGIAGEQILDAPWPLPTAVWTHVAVVLDGAVGILYTNGVPVATNMAIDLVPGNLGATNNYLGKSQWPDPYFNGQLSGVRFFPRPLKVHELLAPLASIAQPDHGALFRPGESISFSGSAVDYADATISPTGLAWTVQWVINGTTTSTVLGPVSGVTNGTFTVPATGPSSTNGIYRVTLVAVDAAGRRGTNVAEVFPVSATTLAPDWGSFYSFNIDGRDSSNRFNGSLIGGALIQTDAQRGKILNLSGSGQYLSLPTGASAAQTVSAWVKWRGGAPWQRVFDLGVDTECWFFFTPANGSGEIECNITSDGSEYTYSLQPHLPFPLNTWTHVAVSLSGREAVLFLNGNPVAINNGVDLIPADLQATKAWFGRSMFSADAYFNGQLDSITLNSRGLALDEILAPWPAILQPAAGTLYAGGNTIAFSGTAWDYAGVPLPAEKLTWRAEFYRDGQVERLSGPWPGITNGTFLVPTNDPPSTNVFYRVTLAATDSNAYSAFTSTDLLPRVSELTLDTVPSGLQVGFEGASAAAPARFSSVAGMVRTVSAPISQVLGGTNYDFALWSDGGAATHAIAIPPTNSTIFASYQFPELGYSVSGGELAILWPAWAGSLALHSATNLAPPITWTPSGQVPVLSNGTLSVVVTNPAGTRFFRLQAPD